MGESKSPPKRVSRKRRMIMLLAGVGLGLACRLAPEHLQGPCSVVVRVLALFMGVPT